MRVLILGVSGLIGHKLLLELSNDFEIFGVLHKTKDSYGNLPLFSKKNIIENINICDFDILKGVLLTIKPEVVINCVGITKRKAEINNVKNTITINSIFPHILADWTKTNNIRLIHLSTDCVFNGNIGNYNENSLTTAEDLYGRTKALGEINYSHSLTIRSSFIGQELFGKTELLEWFIKQEGKKISGYTNTYYSGVSTNYIANVLKTIISDFPLLSGLYNLAPEFPISKYDLLCIAKDAYKLKIDIIPEDKYVHYPTLDGTKLKDALQLKIPTWEIMMEELAKNKKIYKF